MMRKVMQHGPSTLTISLPHAWVKHWRIKKGDEVRVTPKGETLLVTCDSGKPTDEKTRIDVTGLDRTTIQSAIRHAYRRGFDEIIVTSKNDAAPHLRLKQNIPIPEILREEVNRLIGMEIIHQADRSYTIRDITGHTKTDSESVYRRAILLLEEECRTTIDGLKNNDHERLYKVEEQQRLISKLVSYYLRLLTRHSHDDTKYTHLRYTIVTHLDELADAFKYAARYALRAKKPLSHAAMNILPGISASVASFIEIAHKQSPERIVAASANRRAVSDALQETQLQQGDAAVISHIARVPEILFVLTEALYGLSIAESK